MKNLIILIALILSSMVGAQQNKYQKFYSDFEDLDGITTISINKAMFKMLGAIEMDEDIKELTPLFKKMNSIKMVIYDGKRNSEIKNKLKSEFQNLNLEELMAINNEGNKVRFYTENSSSEVFKNLMLNISSVNELIYIILDGEINADDLGKMIKKAE